MEAVKKHEGDSGGVHSAGGGRGRRSDTVVEVRHSSGGQTWQWRKGSVQLLQIGLWDRSNRNPNRYS